MEGNGTDKNVMHGHFRDHSRQDLMQSGRFSELVEYWTTSAASGPLRSHAGELLPCSPQALSCHVNCAFNMAILDAQFNQVASSGQEAALDLDRRFDDAVVLHLRFASPGYRYSRLCERVPGKIQMRQM